MRLSEFERLVEDEFGAAKGEWITHSHVLGTFGVTAEVAVAGGEDLREVWLQLCEDFSVPQERRLGTDLPGI